MKLTADQISFHNNGSSSFEVLSRYETYLTNNLYKALHELERLQGARKTKQ